MRLTLQTRFLRIDRPQLPLAQPTAFAAVLHRQVKIPQSCLPQVALDYQEDHEPDDFPPSALTLASTSTFSFTFCSYISSVGFVA
mmetsp:Transcript_43318/g.107782  ORF Transcript_43318/g.107782 Transcript_43318/m.107782 type:complete len:85 (-) Transcript_43318:303-557(-)